MQVKLPTMKKFFYVYEQRAVCLFDEQWQAEFFIDILILNEGWWL